MKTYQFAIAICTVFVALPAFAQTPPSGTGLTANPVFEKDCARCHGKTAKGRRFGGPSLTTTKAAGMSTEQLHNMITNGKGHIPKFHMPKFRSKLSSDEIDALVRQIQALNEQAMEPRGPRRVSALTARLIEDGQSA